MERRASSPVQPGGTPGSPPASLFVAEAPSQQHAGNRSRHQISHGSGQHGANAETGEFAALIGSERADAAQLNSDRTQIREAAKRESRDRKRAGIEHGSLRSEHGEGYQFV